MAPSRIDDNAVSAAIPTVTKTAAAAAPVSPTSSTVSRTFGTTSMIESKFLSHPEDLGVVAVGFSGGQAISIRIDQGAMLVSNQGSLPCDTPWVVERWKMSDRGSRDSVGLNRGSARSAHSLARKQVRRPASRRLDVDLGTFARQGGPGLSDLRGRREPAILYRMDATQPQDGGSASTSRPTTSETRSRPNDGAFLQHILDYNIYPSGYRDAYNTILPEPENADKIRRVLKQRRPSLASSRFTYDDFCTFREANAYFANGRGVRELAVPILEGGIGDFRHSAGGVRFGNLDPLTDGSLAAAHPGRYYGARPEHLDRQIRQQLDCRIIPSTRAHGPILPNFFLEAEGPDDSPAVAERKALYHATLGQRGMLDLLSYGESEPVHDRKAYTLACTYQAGQLSIYTSHTIPPASPGARPQYVTTKVAGYALTGDHETCRRGIAAYRNGRDWAQQQRNEAIERANRKAAATGAGTGTGAHLLQMPTQS
ncbi:hypothetical protein QBC42DRAFT_346532 [Cladorrhinum samala]|uniref:Uncharacterized protein n=1 Tax=Cladorrhinum samala TaxID=585594 RepID=A0AAV9HNE4_9PEZI|nr:hypothetical protein QBC42DRAFT_346532 [Cladorrhinum samala]